MTRRHRIGHIAATGLGLQVAAIEDHLRRHSLGIAGADAPTRLLIGRAANRQYIRMARRHVGIVESALLSSALQSVRPIIRHFGGYREITPDLWAYEEFARSTASLAFTPEEEARGRANLEAMGIGANDWFVCFHVRDSGAPGGTATAYKRASLDRYLGAVAWLTEQGGFALRMGTDVATSLPNLNDPRVIDYAARWRSDFMDVYLCAKCRFFLGSSAGLAYLAIAFDVPVAIANLAPLGNPPQSARDRFVPKLMCRKGIPLAFDDIHRLGLFGADGRRAAEFGIEYRDDDSEDIIALCKSMLHGDPPGATPLQERYRDRFFANCPGFRFAPLIDGHFALKYRHLMPEGETSAVDLAPRCD